MASGALVEVAPRPNPRAAAAPRVVRGAGAVPEAVLRDPALNAAAAALPANYNLEVHKTVWRCRQGGHRRVALQFPEGLLLFACTIADILKEFAGVEHCVIMGDVTYGACCVDDFTAAALGCDFLVHYGHSCLVPVSVTSVPCMYVFVDIQVDFEHLLGTVRLNFAPGARLLLAGVVQFNSTVRRAREALQAEYPALAVPQCKPLSHGEVLGCTAPCVDAGRTDAIVFVADGRFHLEAIMIANPTVPAYRYDPYERVLTREEYDHAGMRAARRRAIGVAQNARQFGLILGTLGRQGNPAVLERLERRLAGKGIPYVVVLLSEITLEKLRQFRGVEAWVQIACPRLSIDWGEGFEDVPLLNPYEAMVALGAAAPWWEDGGGPKGNGTYPMDYYDKDGGEWGSTYVKRRGKKGGGPLARGRALLAGKAEGQPADAVAGAF